MLKMAAACPDHQVQWKINMMSEKMHAWFAVQVCSRAEHKVVAILEHKGYRCLFPTYQSKRKWATQTKILRLPLFPGYIFCRIRERVVGLVMTTPGVVRILGTGKRPYPVADSEIDAIQKASLDESAGPCAYLNVGQKVRIKSGPLAGLTGFLTQKRNQHRLVVSVQLIMKSMSVEVDPFNLCPVEESEPLPGADAIGTAAVSDPGLYLKEVI